MKNLLLILVAITVFAFTGCDNQSVNDAGITTKVKTKLAADTETSALRVSVDTANGVVTLTGSVPTQAEKAAAERVARTTEDVRSVVNNIAVNPSLNGAVDSATPMTTASPGDRTSGTNRDAGDALSDAGVLAKIKAQYVANGIIGTNVDVTNGAVLLKGEVESAAEKTKAEQIARQTEGVKSVKNTLVVKKS